jgi:hypothetical protein
VRRSALIGALAQHRDLDVVVMFDGVRLPVTGLRYAPQQPVGEGGSSDDLQIEVSDGGLWQIAVRYEPGDDDEALPQLVTTLRVLWDQHTASPRGRAQRRPDFYAWASELLRGLYGSGFLAVPLPDDVDPNGPCKCARTLDSHLPRGTSKCLYYPQAAP